MQPSERVSEWITNVYAILVAGLVGVALLGLLTGQHLLTKLVIVGVLCSPGLGILVVAAVDRGPWHIKAYGLGTLLLFSLGVVFAIR